MKNELLKLEPSLMWKYFYEITQIPRPSKKEEKIRAYLVNFGKTFNLETKVDEIGNVLITKPGTKGFENKKMTVLQSHMDMVCEKNSDMEFDFDNDPINPRIEGEWVKATGTTLGADDGIGIAASLAILADNNLEHGPIEALFTMDEETGLTGAFGLTEDFLKSKILLNLDSEDEGELFIGCAGGRDTVIELPFKNHKVQDEKIAFEVSIGGLNGGHSGDDINKGLANANKLMVRLLSRIWNEMDANLMNINCGNLRNAIAREGKATIFIPTLQSKKLEEIVVQMTNIFKSEYHKTEQNLYINIQPVEVLLKNSIDHETANKLINSLYACPHGVLAMSQDMFNFVETSTNLASVKMKDDHILITTSQRSSVESALDSACEMVAATFKLVGAKIEHTDGYPGWAPNPNSEIVEITAKAYRDIFKKEPKVLAIHAGLECGLIGKKYPGLDMISFGPTIKGAHSPDERLKIDTAIMFWDLLLEVLKRIPDNK
jgi:dipeptidase D